MTELNVWQSLTEAEGDVLASAEADVLALAGARHDGPLRSPGAPIGRAIRQPRPRRAVTLLDRPSFRCQPCSFSASCPKARVLEPIRCPLLPGRSRRFGLAGRDPDGPQA
jgi:hypothetical protein